MKRVSILFLIAGLILLLKAIPILGQGHRKPPKTTTHLTRK